MSEETDEEPEKVDPELKETLLRLAQSGETDELSAALRLNTRALNEVRDWTGDSLLAIACWHNKYETAKMLVELGADVDSTNNNGSTPLHRACYRNNIELVILLTNHGADYNIRDKHGRKAADVGDRICKKVIAELQRISIEEKERETLAQMELEQEKEEIEAMAREEERLEVVRKRQQRAVPIVLSGARYARINGCYEPVDEVHCDWPIYSLRGDRDIYMVYVNNEWLIQCEKDKGTSKAYVRLLCNTPTYPELRAEGTNGIVESSLSKVLGVPFTLTATQSRITIITEEEALGNRATEMFKLAARVERAMSSESIASDENEDSLPLVDDCGGRSRGRSFVL